MQAATLKNQHYGEFEGNTQSMGDVIEKLLK